MPETRRRRPAARRQLTAEAEPTPDVQRRKLVLVAGAGGVLGSCITAELRQRGYRVRALTRSPATLHADVDEVFSGDLLLPNSLKGACLDVDAVISCAGAKVGFVGLGKGKFSFSQVDDLGNRNLLAEAKGAGVKKMVYVSVFGGRVMGAVEYIRAHESFAAALKASGLDYGIIRPTGFFSAFKRVFDMAKKGRVTLIGAGSATTNPIADKDLGALCVDALDGHRQEIDAGGPDVLTRREIAELAFQALGRAPKFRRIPVLAAGPFVRLLRLTGRHNYDIGQFLTLASITDLVAPTVGTRRLEDYFKELAASQ